MAPSPVPSPDLPATTPAPPAGCIQRQVPARWVAVGVGLGVGLGCGVAAWLQLRPGLATLVWTVVLAGLSGVLAVAGLRAWQVLSGPAAPAGPPPDHAGDDQTDVALRVSEEVINASAEVISVIDQDHVYRMVNDAWCRAAGLRRDQVIGRRSTDVLPGTVTDERAQALDRCLHLRQRITVRDKVVYPNAPARHLHTEFYPITTSTGSRPMAALASRDVSIEELQREALSTAAEVLRCTLDATGDALFATDADGDQLDQPVRFANAQLFQLYEMPDTWQPTPTLRQIIEGIDRWLIDREAHHRRVQDIIEGRAPAQDEIQLNDGRVLLRRYASVPMGERRLRVWSMRDITAEKRAVEAREAAAVEQQSLLDQYPGFISVVDQNDHYVYVNRRLATELRLSPEAIMGRGVAEVFGPERAQSIQHHLQQARRHGRSVSESRFSTIVDRAATDVEVTHVAGPRHADGSQRVYAFGTDITERKRAQLALAAALAEAERANRTKSQFLSRMSHELRTPLNAVLGFGQLLQLQPMPADQRRQVDEILRGGRHLLSLINDLLDLGRIEAGELEVVCEAVCADTAIDGCLGLMRPLAQERAITLHHATATDPTISTWADPKRLRQVLLNLLSNAIKYNQPGGRVELDFEPIGSEVEFRVHDTGPGLTEHEQQRLFQPFERLGAGQSAVDGTGIGLALSRSLVEAMGGRIGVHSSPGQGSTFWFRLPRAGSAGEVDDTAGPAADPRAGSRQRALYIEDNPVNQLLMTAMLEDEFELEVEGEPFAGLDRARTRPPDLILLDIQLPGIDGFEVLRRLRADPLTQHIPVVAVSANAMPADLDAGRAAGFDAYLSKPVDMAELLATVHRLALPQA